MNNACATICHGADNFAIFCRRFEWRRPLRLVMVTLRLAKDHRLHLKYFLMLHIRRFSLVAFLMLGVWGLHDLRPVIQILSGPVTCCLECKRNYCPAKKTEASATPSCHNTESSATKNELSRTCNHSNDVQVLHPDAILVQESSTIQNHISFYDSELMVSIAFEAIQPASPPPKTGARLL